MDEGQTLGKDIKRKGTNYMEQKDLEMIKNVMESVVDERLTDSENLILVEVGRVRKILEDRMNQLQENTDELNQYCHSAKQERDNTALLLKMIEDLTKRVEELEHKTA